MSNAPYFNGIGKGTCQILMLRSFNKKLEETQHAMTMSILATSITHTHRLYCFSCRRASFIPNIIITSQYLFKFGTNFSFLQHNRSIKNHLDIKPDLNEIDITKSSTHTSFLTVFPLKKRSVFRDSNGSNRSSSLKESTLCTYGDTTSLLRVDMDLG